MQALGLDVKVLSENDEEIQIKEASEYDDDVPTISGIMAVSYTHLKATAAYANQAAPFPSLMPSSLSACRPGRRQKGQQKNGKMKN